MWRMPPNTSIELAMLSIQVGRSARPGRAPASEPPTSFRVRLLFFETDRAQSDDDGRKDHHFIEQVHQKVQSRRSAKVSTSTLYALISLVTESASRRAGISIT